MRSDILRVYKVVHTWTGILSGMALFIAFYAGALTVFKEPLERWVSPPVADVAVPLSDAPSLIAHVLQDYPDAAREFSLHLREDEPVPARMRWKVRKEGSDDHDQSATRHYMATLDAKGHIQVQEAHLSQLADFIDVLHRVVGLPVDNDHNRWIMGVIAVLYTLALVSGVVVLLPSLVKDFFALRVGKNLKRMWLDAHNVVGIISLPFHLMMALTAVVFAFHDDIYSLQDKLFGTRGPAAPQVSAAVPRDPMTLLPPTDLVARAQALSPTFEPSMLQYVQAGGAHPVVRVWGRDDTALSPGVHGGFVALDPYTGRITNRNYLPGHQNALHTMISSFFALHMAAYGGITVQWLYFLLGLAGAWLFYSGNLLWIETRRRKARFGNDGLPVQRLDVRLMASATVGVCLGCICGISLTIVAGKWLYGHVNDLNAWHRYIYYAVFFASIAWAFLRGGAKAAVHLLWLAAACTLTIPLTTLLAWLAPTLGLWAHTGNVVLGVDATALAGALCFVWVARSTSRRIRLGVPDSVWSGR
jgi:uncharacterized iron-regulated membrane protein